MEAPARRFEVIQEDSRPAPPQQSRSPGIETDVLLMALRALSQRAVIALWGCFHLITVGFVFWATLSILPDPSQHQLIGLGIFSAFVLAINWMILRRRG